jgi:hypothetical protein
MDAAHTDANAVRRHWLFVVVLASGCQESPSLSTTAQELVNVSPSSYDFGTLEVGMTSAPRVINVNPGAGNQSDTILSITESCPDYFVTADGLPAEVYRVCEFGIPQAAPAPCTTTELQSYSFTAQFQPNIGSPTSCVVTVALASGGTRTVTLSGTGTIPPIRIDVAPTSVPFGDVRRNTTSGPAAITVRNLGGGNLSVASVSTSGPFAITAGPTSTVIGPSGAQPYSVVCQPTAVGGVAGSFIVQSNDPAQPTVTVPLSCNGIDSNLDISPSPLALQITRVGEPVEQDVQLINSGAASMTLQSVELASTDLELVSAPSAGTVLAGSGGSAPVRIRFAAAAAITAEGTLTATYDGGQTRTSQISAHALATSMALTPDGEVDLGPVCVGQSKSQPFTIVANADAGFDVTAISSPDAPFTLTSPALPASVKGSGGSMLPFDVVAAPTTAGAVSSLLTVTTDIPGAAPREIRLSAVALAEGVAGSPDILDLGSQQLEVTSIGQSVKVANCTAAPTTLANARIEGPGQASFAIVQQPSSASLPASAVASWLVVFTPRALGPTEATFSVDHEGGTTTIDLVGEGLGDDVAGGDAGPPSYYSCSTGGATALWIVGPLLIVLRRRKRAR